MAYSAGPIRTTARFFDTSAFTIAPQFTLGNSSRNPVRGPAYRNADVVLIKRIFFGERKNIELRAEAFNVTNSFIPAGVSGTVTTGAITIGNSLALNNNTFGQIRTAQPPRIMQFALKYIF